MAYDPTMLGGWHNRPDEVNKVMAAKPNYLFSQAAPDLLGIWQGEDIGLWEAAKKVNGGQHIPADKQTIGDCVSHGHARGLDYAWCAAQAAGQASGYIEGKTSAQSETIYGASRQFGNGLGWQDGSVGAWAVGALHDWGYLFRDGKQYDGQLAKQLGAKGITDAMKKDGQGQLLTDYAQINDPQHAADALMSGRPITICSDQGFSMTRNADGICTPQGTWNHCMVVIGVYTVNNKRYFVILQSWGQNTPSGPTPAGGAAPDNSFGCPWDTMGHILGMKDSYVLNAVKNWQPLPPLNWIM